MDNKEKTKQFVQALIVMLGAGIVVISAMGAVNYAPTFYKVFGWAELFAGLYIVGKYGYEKLVKK